MKNPQSGSESSSSGNNSGAAKKHTHKALPPLFWYMEMGEWEKATERANRHPREVKTWATLRTKSMADSSKVSGTKRLALHHACFKLRSVVPDARGDSDEKDAFIDVCKFILLLTKIFPEAAGVRESRHGCLPLHLAAFASCAPRPKDSSSNNGDKTGSFTPASPKAPLTPRSVKSLASGAIPRPPSISVRSVSEKSTETNMSAIIAEEKYTGNQTYDLTKPTLESVAEPTTNISEQQQQPQASSPPATPPTVQPNVSVSQKSNTFISAKREDMAVEVINALLDAYPKGSRVDSEGGRLPLHTACAGRATPRVVQTLITAYPAAARHRNKDGFLPLHLAAHWGVSHPNVAICLLKIYPDSTLGRNRWERTPLEEALCMAGENGRPHQAALVRALRKHPSYWTRPPEKLFVAGTINLLSNRLEGTNLVDIDETLPDDDTTLEEREAARIAANKDPDGRNVHLSPRLGRGRKQAEEIPIYQTVPLPTLIKNQNWDAAMARLNLYPHEAGEAMETMTRGGFMATSGLTPLHYACERHPPLLLVEALLAAWPEAVSTRLQPGGALPLHVACTWQGSTEVATALCRAEPAACRIPDELGNVPLHCACFSGAPLEVVDGLLSIYPKSVLARNHQGSLPSDIVRRLRHDNRKPVVKLLDKRKEEVLEAHHRRSKSSGSFGPVAIRAKELNEKVGVPKKSSPEKQQELTDGHEGHDIEMEAGVEVTYENTEDNQGGASSLVWI